MKEIKIQNNQDGSWTTVTVLDFSSRPDSIQVQKGGQEPEWVHLNEIHPADKVAITVERIALERYEYVPKEDLK